MRVTTTLILFSVIILTGGTYAAVLDFSLVEMYTLTGFPGEGNFVRISDVAYDVENGEVLVADEGRKRIYLFRSDGTAYKILGISPEIPAPSKIAPGRGGKLFITESSTGRVFALDRVTGEEITGLVVPGEEDAGDAAARGIATNQAGQLYLVGKDEQKFILFDNTGTFVIDLGSEGRLKRFIAMDIDDRGRLLVATKNMTPIHLFDDSGKFLRDVSIRDFSTARMFSDIGGIAFDQLARIWASFPLDDVIRVFDETGSLLAEVKGEEIPGGLFSPTDIEITPIGEVIVLERGFNRVRQFSVEVAR
jgi:DNA-binding beta-propeller fold protein YncE